MRIKNYEVYWDRIFVLSLLIGMMYSIWLTSSIITFEHIYIISFMTICCFIILFKNPLVIKINYSLDELHEKEGGK